MSRAVPEKRLAVLLRALRKDAGMSTTELASQLGWSQSKVSKTDLGRTLPQPSDVEAWARVTNASDAVRRELTALATDAGYQATELRRELAPGRRRKQEEIQRMEANASVVRVFSPALIAGLAQTRPYAAAMLKMGRGVGKREDPTKDIVDARMARQNVLKDTTKRFFLLMGETALRRRLVDDGEMRDQVDRLVKLSSLVNVTVGVIPFAADERVHQYHGFAILGAPDLDDESRVLVETVTRALVVRAPIEIADYVAYFDELRAGALEGDDLRDFLSGQPE